MTPAKGSWSDRFFRFLLRVLPFDFRSDYGEEMEQTFREQQRDARREGGTGLLRLWWQTSMGIFHTAPREHWEMLRQDTGFALRMMRKNWGYALLAILTLGLGIGANTAIFSVIEGVLLRDLPYAQSNQLVRLRQDTVSDGVYNIGFSVKDIADYRQENHTLSGIVEYHSMWFTLLGRSEPERLQIGVVSANLFDVMGVRPILGRTFLREDDRLGAPAVLLLSYSYWQQQMGGATDVVGKTFSMNDRVYTVIGVLPPLPKYPDDNSMFMPTSACPFRSNPSTIADRGARMLNAYARLKPGVSIGQVSADLNAIAGRLADAYPKDYPAKSGFQVGVHPLLDEMTREAQPVFLFLLGAAGLVLLIACANVANLTLSRQVRRAPELAVRTAMGAGAVRLLRQLVTESMILALAGGALGLSIAAVGLNLLARVASQFTPRTADIGIDGTVLLFTLGASLLTGILFGCTPALPSRMELAGALREGAGRSATARRQRVRSLLIVSQVAISFVLLIGAGLLLRSLWKIRNVDSGSHPESVLSMNISLNWTKYNDSVRRIAFRDDVLRGVEALPGVHSAAFSMSFPMNTRMGSMMSPIVVEGQSLPPGAPAPLADYRVASADYFRTVGIPLLEGRTFDERDTLKAPQVAIVNQSMARHFWGNQDPIGRRLSFDQGKTWIQVVGIVGDVHEYGLDRPPADGVYVSITQQPTLSAALLVRTSGAPMSIARQVIAVVHRVDAQQPVAWVETLDQVRNHWLESRRLTAILLALFAGLALVITSTGISGAMALWVSQRTHEIGVRMALGATRAKVLRMVLGQGMALVLAGLSVGVLSALGLTRLVSRMLFGVKASDPLTFLFVAFVLAAVAAAACLIPCRRAASIDPIIALRCE